MPGYSLLLLGSCLLCIVIILDYRTQWAGFGAYDPPSDKHQRMKTLWDWLQLLIIPVFLTGGGFWFTAQQNALSQQLSQQQYNQSKWITSDQQKDMTLVTTMNDLSDLLLNKGLYASQPGAEVRVIARAKILSAFSVLDTTRKSRLLRFLVEAQIVTSKPSQEPIISLSGADLSGANLLIINLSGADLRNVNLSQANLSKADLTGADLTCADLSNANLSKADLSGANLNGIELNGTNLSNTNLKEARRGDPQRSKCP